jgi:hypothetical protein
LCVDGTLPIGYLLPHFTADNQTKTYGDTFTFAGNEFTTSAMVGSESIASVTLTSAGAAASATVASSPYSIVPSNAVAGTGTDLNNYSITYVNGTLTVNQKELTVSGITANNKAYDGNTTATLNTGSALLVGVVSGDDVSLDTSGAIGTFDTPSAGVGKTVTVSGLTISGADAGNYYLTQPTTTADIVYSAGQGSVPGPDKDYLIIDMLGERTLVEIDSYRNTTMEECQAYCPEGMHLLSLQENTLLQCGDCEGCDCYPKIIVMSLSDETIEPPEGMTLVSPLYDFTGYKDIRQEMACNLATYFDPTATVLLNYDPNLLPLGASDPVIGFYSHSDNRWVLLPPDTGRVAEDGFATGVTGYFASPFAVLASAPPEETPEPPPANPSPAHFVASGLSITPPEVKTGEAVTISLNVTNDGEESGTYTVELKISGSTVDSKIVTLDGGQGQAVSFAVSASEAGTYDASVAGLNGSFTVEKSSMWWIYLIIAAVVILAGVLVLLIRRRASS